MITKDVVLGKNVKIFHPELVNLYGCRIGANTKIGCFVEIRKGVTIGRNCKISPFAFIPEGVKIEDGVFIGPGVMFTNDKYPRATDESGRLLQDGDWRVIPTFVRNKASIGANATILCGVTIGEGAIVGGGAVVTKDVLSGQTVVGNPARRL